MYIYTLYYKHEFSRLLLLLFSIFFFNYYLFFNHTYTLMFVNVYVCLYLQKLQLHLRRTKYVKTMLSMINANLLVSTQQ